MIYVSCTITVVFPVQLLSEGKGIMIETLQERVESVSKILKSNSFVDIIDDKSINNNGIIYVSSSQKNNLKGCPVIIIVLKNKGMHK
jgi:hypothetical protein